MVKESLVKCHRPLYFRPLSHFLACSFSRIPLERHANGHEHMILNFLLQIIHLCKNAPQKSWKIRKKCSMAWARSFEGLASKTSERIHLPFNYPLCCSFYFATNRQYTQTFHHHFIGLYPHHCIVLSSHTHLSPL